jgi:hypothetical protein
VTEKDGRRPSRRMTASTRGGGGRGPASDALVHLLPHLTGAGRRGGVGDEAKGARRPPPEPTDGARGAKEADDEGGCEGQPTETEDDTSGAGSLGEAATAAKVYLRGPARLPPPPLPQNRLVICPQGRM